MAINPLDLILRQEEINRKYPGLLTSLQEDVVNQAPPLETVGQEPIVAAGTRAPSVASPTISPEDLIPRPINNREFIEQRDQDLRNGVEAAPHKGLFGVKGTLRDILGFVGDSLLVGSGKSPIYGAVRQRERMGDAMAGFTQDPAGAAERMTGIDPTSASKLQELAINEQLKRAQLASTEEYRRSMADARKFETATKATNVIARIFSSPVAQTNPDLAMRQAQQISRQIGIPLEELGVSPDMTPEEMRMYGSRDMTVNQQMQLPYKERMTTVAERNADTAEQNAASNRIRANRPPAGRPAPNPTSASMAAPLLNKLQRGGKLTPAETEALDRMGYALPKKGRGTPRPAGAPTPPPGFKYVKKPN